MIASEMTDLETRTLWVNGKIREVPPVQSLGELLRALEVDARQVVVELNQVIIRRPQLEETPVKQDDQVEILRFVGGG